MRDHRDVCRGCNFWDMKSLRRDFLESKIELTGEFLELIETIGYCRFFPPGAGLPDNPWDKMVVTAENGWCGQFNNGVDMADLDPFLRRNPDLEEVKP